MQYTGYVKNPYQPYKIRTGVWGVRFHQIINGKINVKHKCGQCTQEDAKLIAKLLNENWSEKNDKE